MEVSPSPRPPRGPQLQKLWYAATRHILLQLTDRKEIHWADESQDVVQELQHTRVSQGENTPMLQAPVQMSHTYLTLDELAKNRRFEATLAARREVKLLPQPTLQDLPGVVTHDTLMAVNSLGTMHDEDCQQMCLAVHELLLTRNPRTARFRYKEQYVALHGTWGGELVPPNMTPCAHIEHHMRMSFQPELGVLEPSLVAMGPAKLTVDGVSLENPFCHNQLDTQTSIRVASRREIIGLAQHTVTEWTCPNHGYVAPITFELQLCGPLHVNELRLFYGGTSSGDYPFKTWIWHTDPIYPSRPRSNTDGVEAEAREIWRLSTPLTWARAGVGPERPKFLELDELRRAKRPLREVPISDPLYLTRDDVMAFTGRNARVAMDMVMWAIKYPEHAPGHQCLTMPLAEGIYLRQFNGNPQSPFLWLWQRVPKQYHEHGATQYAAPELRPLHEREGEYYVAAPVVVEKGLLHHNALIVTQTEFMLERRLRLFSCEQTPGYKHIERMLHNGDGWITSRVIGLCPRDGPEFTNLEVHSFSVNSTAAVKHLDRNEAIQGHAVFFANIGYWSLHWNVGAFNETNGQRRDITWLGVGGYMLVARIALSCELGAMLRDLLPNHYSYVGHNWGASVPPLIPKAARVVSENLLLAAATRLLDTRRTSELGFDEFVGPGVIELPAVDSLHLTTKNQAAKFNRLGPLLFNLRAFCGDLPPLSINELDDTEVGRLTIGVGGARVALPNYECFHNVIGAHRPNLEWMACSDYAMDDTGHPFKPSYHGPLCEPYGMDRTLQDLPVRSTKLKIVLEGWNLHHTQYGWNHHERFLTTMGEYTQHTRNGGTTFGYHDVKQPLVSATGAQTWLLLSNVRGSMVTIFFAGKDNFSFERPSGPASLQLSEGQSFMFPAHHAYHAEGDALLYMIYFTHERGMACYRCKAFIGGECTYNEALLHQFMCTPCSRKRLLGVTMIVLFFCMRLRHKALQHRVYSKWRFLIGNWVQVKPPSELYSGFARPLTNLPVPWVIFDLPLRGVMLHPLILRKQRIDRLERVYWPVFFLKVYWLLKCMRGILDRRYSQGTLTLNAKPALGLWARVSKWKAVRLINCHTSFRVDMQSVGYHAAHNTALARFLKGYGHHHFVEINLAEIDHHAIKRIGHEVDYEQPSQQCKAFGTPMPLDNLSLRYNELAKEYTLDLVHKAVLFTLYDLNVAGWQGAGVLRMLYQELLDPPSGNGIARRWQLTSEFPDELHNMLEPEAGAPSIANRLRLPAYNDEWYAVNGQSSDSARLGYPVLLAAEASRTCRRHTMQDWRPGKHEPRTTFAVHHPYDVDLEFNSPYHNAWDPDNTPFGSRGRIEQLHMKGFEGHLVTFYRHTNWRVHMVQTEPDQGHLQRQNQLLLSYDPETLVLPKLTTFAPYYNVGNLDPRYIHCAARNASMGYDSRLVIHPACVDAPLQQRHERKEARCGVRLKAMLRVEDIPDFFMLLEVFIARVYYLVPVELLFKEGEWAFQAEGSNARKEHIDRWVGTETKWCQGQNHYDGHNHYYDGTAFANSDGCINVAYLQRHKLAWTRVDGELECSLNWDLVFGATYFDELAMVQRATSAWVERFRSDGGTVKLLDHVPGQWHAHFQGRFSYWMERLIDKDSPERGYGTGDWVTDDGVFIVSDTAELLEMPILEMFDQLCTRKHYQRFSRRTYTSVRTGRWEDGSKLGPNLHFLSWAADIGAFTNLLDYTPRTRRSDKLAGRYFRASGYREKVDWQMLEESVNSALVFSNQRNFPLDETLTLLTHFTFSPYCGTSALTFKGIELDYRFNALKLLKFVDLWRVVALRCTILERIGASRLLRLFAPEIRRLPHINFLYGRWQLDQRLTLGPPEHIDVGEEVTRFKELYADQILAAKRWRALAERLYKERNAAKRARLV